MMRHAHSEERLTNVRDHDRPITEAGRASAQEVRCMAGPQTWQQGSGTRCFQNVQCAQIVGCSGCPVLSYGMRVPCMHVLELGKHAPML